MWTKIPEKGENLVITSSRKDALTIIENCQIPTLSLQGEGYIPKEKVINILKERYKKYFLYYMITTLMLVKIMEGFWVIK